MPVVAGRISMAKLESSRTGNLAYPGLPTESPLAGETSERLHEVGSHSTEGPPYRVIGVSVDIETHRVDAGEEPIGELLPEATEMDHRRRRIHVTLVDVDGSTVVRDEPFVGQRAGLVPRVLRHLFHQGAEVLEFSFLHLQS